MTAGRREPELTNSMRAAAKQRPGQWLYSIDPGFDPEGEVPAHGVVGAWQIDQTGNVVRFMHNPNYKPSPMALGLTPPVNDLENKLQLTATGYCSEQVFLDELLRAEILVYSTPERQRPFVISGENDRGVLEGCTSPDYLPQDWPGAVPMPVRVLAKIPGGVDLRINPGSRVTVTIPFEDLYQAIAASPETSDEGWK
ncbi:type VII secretion system-associated protein [Streptomyces sp. CB01881]|uniref:type VII secretion system-associated protein n=1 Tax=Streptomyces sp. CB01881 TaxID=2078691 RepID=UPI0013870A70|nr:type VII secretion system-associated protein [Streptomyces sp. CB01881]